MSAFRYDLHIHSCLSPCAEDDMTPWSIAGMAKLNGLELVALTDHNSCGNCASFFCACREYGIVPVPGMELTTAEDIHLVCLLPDLAEAEAFDRAVRAQRAQIPNRPEIFGRQLRIDAQDEICGEEPTLLIHASDLTLEEAWELCRFHGGAAFPAHIDREANGMLAVLGGMPLKPYFTTVEFHDAANVLPYEQRYGLQKQRKLVNSDAHRLWELSAGEQSIRLACQAGEDDAVRHALIAKLRGDQ